MRQTCSRRQNLDEIVIAADVVPEYLFRTPCGGRDADEVYMLRGHSDKAEISSDDTFLTIGSVISISPHAPRGNRDVDIVFYYGCQPGGNIDGKVFFIVDSAIGRLVSSNAPRGSRYR